MICYKKLFELLEEKSISTYYLRNKSSEYNISASTIARLKRNESVSTHTLNALCEILDCKIEDIIEFKKE
ncbi:MAG: helix-turn-helix transcriptional regulator [Clostridia bacterium]